MHIAIVAQTETWSRGLSIAGAGLLIVFAVLILLSVFIASLPHLLGWLEPYLPAAEHSHGVAAPASDSLSDDAAVIAAIGYALHVQQNPTEDSTTGPKGN